MTYAQIFFVRAILLAWATLVSAALVTGPASPHITALVSQVACGITTLAQECNR